MNVHHVYVRQVSVEVREDVESLGTVMGHHVCAGNWIWVPCKEQ